MTAEMKWTHEEENFFSDMDENPKAVYFVGLYSNGEMDRMAVFSTKEKTQNWVESFSENDYDFSIVAPFVIDEPDFGNIPKSQLS